ncbi:hypothetical protein PoB_003113400 [Plakobranchus ocellatus]|uniref:Uncharacterized protein n=1 Tax=Plakobranchus ocellatus TaxID=259542 RepID=A0AAV4ADW5_9GAST|nr:hypothetical protein PoB_003113400 [Plakobranchus ocellatus]
MFSIFLAQRETDDSTAYRSGHWISLLSDLLRKFHRNRLHKNFPNIFLPVAIMFRRPIFLLLGILMISVVHFPLFNFRIISQKAQDSESCSIREGLPDMLKEGVKHHRAYIMT